ncbi:MAG: SDR family oxidoreductase [Leptospira sp.]|nr:SDR family oxidoreductase [Leptospira sp.]
MKSAIITGATEGIGRATAIGIAKLGYKVIVIARNEKKAVELKEEIYFKTGNKETDYFLCELSSLKDVNATSIQIAKKYKQIDVLLNNAGLMMNERSLSKDGYEMNFAVNHLAHFLLTRNLLNSLEKARSARIVVVSSKMYEGAKADYDDLQSEKRYSMMNAYSVSKLFNLFFALELAEQLRKTKTTVNALHPGVVNTSLARDLKGPLKWIFSGIQPLFFSSIEKGAETSIYAATSGEMEGVTGKFLDKKEISGIKPVGLNTQNRKRIWKESEELIKKALKK